MIDKATARMVGNQGKNKTVYLAITGDVRFGEEFMRTWEVEQEQRRQEFTHAVARAIRDRVADIVRPHMARVTRRTHMRG